MGDATAKDTASLAKMNSASSVPVNKTSATKTPLGYNIW
jgi:hypothetical protein